MQLKVKILVSTELRYFWMLSLPPRAVISEANTSHREADPIAGILQNPSISPPLSPPIHVPRIHVPPSPRTDVIVIVVRGSALVAYLQRGGRIGGPAQSRRHMEGGSSRLRDPRCNLAPHVTKKRKNSGMNTDVDGYNCVTVSAHPIPDISIGSKEEGKPKHARVLTNVVEDRDERGVARQCVLSCFPVIRMYWEEVQEEGCVHRCTLASPGREGENGDLDGGDDDRDIPDDERALRCGTPPPSAAQGGHVRHSICGTSGPFRTHTESAAHYHFWFVESSHWETSLYEKSGSGTHPLPLTWASPTIRT
ncbi:hypothetical protein B0H11DRAFT_1922330 [Mycena galericulata]|nr:hypothetical protein B0H11DRAFT_1922330 [Mycena galericulata]